ncbi:hypothetical protein BDW62DRAFT_205922 [Aspergillus aurantiobrunneus]
MSANNLFTFNVAFTVPVNNDPKNPALTVDEVYSGFSRGGEKPHLFASYVADTEVLPGRKSENEFQRRLVIDDGAVHTKRGMELVQDVRQAKNLLTEAITVDSGARSTMIVSRGGAESDGDDAVYLSAVYELHVPDVVPGSDRAREIEREYTQLARGAVNTALGLVRKWKVDGSLEEP